MFEIDGRVALVTGGGRGSGNAVALAAADSSYGAGAVDGGEADPLAG